MPPVLRSAGGTNVPQNLHAFQNTVDELNRKIRALKRQLAREKRERRHEREQREEEEANRPRHGRISKRTKPYFNTGLSRGLNNPSNWCYRNSILQCLLHSPTYIELLNRVHQGCNKQPGECIVCALKTMANRYWTPIPAGATPATLIGAGNMLDAALKNEIPEDDLRIGEDIHDNAQSDPLDFFRYCIYEPLIGGKDEEDENEDAPEIQRTFNTVMSDHWVCRFCNRRHNRQPVATNSLEVELDDGINGRQSLTDMLEDSIFETEFRPECECQQARAAKNGSSWPTQTKHCRLTSTPDILLIRVKRWVVNEAEEGGHQLIWDAQLRQMVMDARKLNNEISYEEYLHLGQFTDNNEEAVYRLDGVVSHRGFGTSVKSGHFIADVRRQAGHGFVDISDSRVTHLKGHKNTFRTLKRPWKLPNNKDFTPFVLVYSRT